jgi:hypothetical protein
MAISEPNATIVTNFEERKFACRLNCSYCTWRRSPHLPRGPQPDALVEEYVAGVRKQQVTISGGGDPLYRPERHFEHLKRFAGIIASHGKKVRVITRETEHVRLLKGVAHRVSVSLDPSTYAGAMRRRSEWGGLDVEYSIVLPPWPTDDIIEKMPYYGQLQRRLGSRLVLRENLGSVHRLDFGGLATGNRALVFVPRELCLSATYLCEKPMTGHELVLDAQALYEHLDCDPDAYMFGGFVRHLVAPKENTEFADVDVAASSPSVRAGLEGAFGYSFDRKSPDGRYPRYYSGMSSRFGHEIHLVELDGEKDALDFVFSAQYDVGHVLRHGGRFAGSAALYPTLGRAMDGIRKRIATRMIGRTPSPLRHESSVAIEAKHKAKLRLRGYTVND